MSHTCTLAGSSCRAEFHLRPARSADHFDLQVELHQQPRRTIATSTPTFIARADVRRLRDYLATHLQRLAADPDAQSQVFVPLELGFQLQALEGEVRGPDDGECTVQIMVRVETDEDQERLYIGCTTVFTTTEIESFLSQLDAAAS